MKQEHHDEEPWDDTELKQAFDRYESEDYDFLQAPPGIGFGLVLSLVVAVLLIGLTLVRL